MAEMDVEQERRFNAAVPELRVLIAKRKSSWQLTSVMEWEDVMSILLERLYRQWTRYDPNRPLDKWANTVITHAIQNLLRKHLYKTARPCISGTSYGANCVYNTGGDGCSWTKTHPRGSGSGVQDCSCPLYKKWFLKKQFRHAVHNPAFIEDHVNEAYSVPGDIQDFEGAKKTIDDNIKRRLTKEEYRIYVYLYVKHLSRKEAAQKLGFKKDDMKGYLKIRTAALKIEEVAKQIVDEFDLIP